MYCACVACHQGVTEWVVLIGYFSFVHIATCTTHNNGTVRELSNVLEQGYTDHCHSLILIL